MSDKTKQVDGDDDDFFPGDHVVTSKRRAYFDHNIFIGEIGHEDDHLERINVIKEAGPDDSIEITITTPGGVIDTALLYVDAIANSEAQILVKAVGMVASAGTLIWCLAPNRVAAPFSAFMFHNAQGYIEGDHANMKDNVVFMNEYIESICKEAYKDILTPTEFDKIFNGGQVYMTGADVIERITQYSKGGK